MINENQSEIDRKKELMRKINALADRGVDGEKANAQALLEKLMQKYGIEECDIINDMVRTHELMIDSSIPFIIRLVSQIAYTVYGNIDERKCLFRITGSKKRNRLFIDCTDSEFLEIVAMYDFYKKHLSDDIDLFFRAFIQSNAIFPPDHLMKKELEEDRSLTADDIALIKLANSIDQHPYHKQITDGGDISD